MTVGIYKVKEAWFGKQWYVTNKEIDHPANRNHIQIPCYIDIPERFNPQETPGGDVMVTCDGVGYILNEVLGVTRNGEPALVWEDPKYGYLHTVRLEEAK